MRRIKRAIFILSLFFSLSFPKPRIELGLKVSRFDVTDWYSVDTGYFDFTVFYEPYYGMSGEFLVSFIKDLYLRGEFGELRFYTKFGKGRSFHLFSGLDFDLIYTIPIKGKISPLAYIGINYERYFGKPDRDIRGYAPTYEFRFGSGLNYRHNEKVKTFLECQLLTKYQIYERKIGSTEEVYKTTKFIFGFPRINLGIRYTL